MADFILTGGPGGGDTATFVTDALGTTFDVDCGTRLARYELRDFDFEGTFARCAVFVGYVEKP